MLLAHWTQFLGANNNTNPKGLPDGIGQNARNLDTIHGDLRGRAGAAAVITLPGLSVQQKTIYRMGRDAPSDTAYWLTWTTDVNAVRSMLATDSTERTYYTGDGLPKYTDNTQLGTAPYPDGFTTLGVPAPTSTLAAAVGTAGTGPTETREYTETFRRANGDESAPNPNPVEISCPGGSSVNLSGLAPPPSGSFGTVTRRIYVSTGSDFQLVLEQAAALTTATDAGTTRLQVLATGGSASRPAWLTPPDNLSGLTELWNGMMGGFFGKGYGACVAYTPHAWPLEYQGVVPDTIVGSATYGQQWVLVTTGLPRLVTGSTSASLSDVPIYLKQGGVSKRSVVGVGHGVCWASQDGLCYFGSLFPAGVITEKFISKAAWAALVPSSIIGVSWKKWYIGFYNTGSVRGGFMIDTTNPVGVIWLDQGADAVFFDLISQSLYLLDTGNVVKKWDAGSALTATFTTDVKRTKDKTTPGRAQVIASTYPVTFSLYGDGTLLETRTVSDSLPFPLPGNYGGANEFYVTVSGTGPIEAVLLAEETDDLP
jgi:hypothetical protein